MGTQLGRRAHTTIDRSKPAASIALAGGNAYTNDARVGIQVGFSDDVAGPFPANFMCFQFGGTSNICDSTAGFIYGYNPACSVPASGGKATTFSCTADFGSGSSPAPDGPVWACVVAADAAIPDNPSGPNQSQSADKANLSDAQCDGVLLDRTAPQVSIDSPTSVKVGELVSFAAQASDAGAGLGSGYEWTYGDSTGAGSGGSVKHTFTQAGTYEVRVRTADAAGNPGTATRVVTVTAPATAAAAPRRRRPTGGGSTGGGSTGGGSTGGGSTGAMPATTVRPTTTAGRGRRVQVLTPRKVKLARSKALPVTLTSDAAGRASFALVRSGRVLARGSKAIAAGTTSYRLKLPRKAKAGRYALKVTFTPTGGRARTATSKVVLVGRAKASASASGVHAPRVSSAGAPVALPDGKFHGVRKRSFVPRALRAG